VNNRPRACDSCARYDPRVIRESELHGRVRFASAWSRTGAWLAWAPGHATSAFAAFDVGDEGLERWHERMLGHRGELLIGFGETYHRVPDTVVLRYTITGLYFASIHPPQPAELTRPFPPVETSRRARSARRRAR
jgi:hypothetical protein